MGGGGGGLKTLAYYAYIPLFLQVCSGPLVPVLLVSLPILVPMSVLLYCPCFGQYPPSDSVIASISANVSVSLVPV